jgi:hypothetical protein
VNEYDKRLVNGARRRRAEADPGPHLVGEANKKGWCEVYALDAAAPNGRRVIAKVKGLRTAQFLASAWRAVGELCDMAVGLDRILLDMMVDSNAYQKGKDEGRAAGTELAAHLITDAITRRRDILKGDGDREEKRRVRAVIRALSEVRSWLTYGDGEDGRLGHSLSNKGPRFKEDAE